MKHEVFILGQTIDQNARRGGTEARGNEERERERIEKGNREGIEKETKRQFEEPTLRCSHCFFKSSGRSSSIKIWVLQAYRMQCHGVKQNVKKCAIGETECNEILSLYLRKTENLSEEKEGMGEREKRED